MTLLIGNRDGGKTDEKGHMVHMSKILSGEVLEGFVASQSDPVAMSVDLSQGSAFIDTGNGYSYNVFSDADETVTIPTADPSNPRNDIVVLYVDLGVTPSTSFTNNSNSMLVATVVSGTASASPVDPSDSAIQTAVGASNPYIKIARVVTPAAATTITDGAITDLRTLVQVDTDRVADEAVTPGKWVNPYIMRVYLGSNQTGIGNVSEVKVAFRS
jgi:hypothetical protein